MPDKTAAGDKIVRRQCSAQEVWRERLTTASLGSCGQSYGTFGDIESKGQGAHKCTRNIAEADIFDVNERGRKEALEKLKSKEDACTFRGFHSDYFLGSRMFRYGTSDQ